MYNTTDLDPQIASKHPVDVKKLGRQRNYHKGRAAIRRYANQPSHPL